jgi:hypothetical protein
MPSGVYGLAKPIESRVAGLLIRNRRFAKMTEPPKRPDPQLSVGFRDSTTAPFVYFDVAATHGVVNGAVQIELVSRILVPLEDGGVQMEFLTTGRLRCSPVAAKGLQDSIQKALEMLSLPQQEQAAAKGTLN